MQMFEFQRTTSLNKQMADQWLGGTVWDKHL